MAFPTSPPTDLDRAVTAALRSELRALWPKGPVSCRVVELPGARPSRVTALQRGGLLVELSVVKLAKFATGEARMRWVHAEAVRAVKAHVDPCPIGILRARVAAAKAKAAPVKAPAKTTSKPISKAPVKPPAKAVAAVDPIAELRVRQAQVRARAAALAAATKPALDDYFGDRVAPLVSPTLVPTMPGTGRSRRPAPGPLHMPRLVAAGPDPIR